MSDRATPPARLGTILVVDDEPVIRDTLTEFLQESGYSVDSCASGEDAIERVTQTRYDVILCDVNLPGLDGIEVLERVAVMNPETFVLLITAYATVETAIEAFQKGAHDYLMKPIILHEVLEKIRRLFHQRDLARENQWLRRAIHRDNCDMVLGRSPAMKRVMNLARRVAPTPSTVLILGESGTGKELMARAIHGFAQGAEKTNALFLAVNCAAIPDDLLESQLFGHRKGAFTGAERDVPGVFAHAGRGTVFLDEIGELPLATQAKLLRVIEQKEIFPVGANEPLKVPARILAATNKDLRKEVAEGRFREDLFYRLNVVAIELPPLRDRRSDIPELIAVLLAKHCRAMSKHFAGIEHGAMQVLLSYSWKGNIRELDNALQRAVILGEGPLVKLDDLPVDVARPFSDESTLENLDAAVSNFEKRHIEHILQVSLDKRDAAKRLGIGLSSLYRKIEQHLIACEPTK